jgi:hypothetical protein
MVSETDKDQGSFYDGLDIKVISGLIHAMNMAGSKLTAYPEGHPFIIESFQKVENILQGIFEARGQLAFGIAKNAVMVGLKVLDQKNPIFQRFAGTLFEQGIVGLTLLRGLTSKELMDFDIIIAQKRNDVYQKGGVDALLSEAAIRHIQVKLIDYGMFQAQEDIDFIEKGGEDLQSLSFWESFVKGLLEGTLDPHGESSKSWNDIEPKTLAEMLNSEYLSQDSRALEGLDFALLANMQNRVLGQLAHNDESKERLFTFINSLNDDLRQSFLERFLNSLPDDSSIASGILSGLPDGIIIDALEKQTNEKLYVPPNILKILQRLKKNPDNVDLEGVDELINEHSKDELAEKLNVIFKEDEGDRFVPLDYQKILQDAIVAEDLSAPELSEVHQLEQTLTGYNINMSLTSIIVNLVVVYSRGQAPDFLKQVLKDQCVSLVKSGDFHVVLNVLETISKKTDYSQADQESPSEDLIAMFSDRSFMEEVLTAATQWGKEKHFYIKKIVQHIGQPFIEPLLDRLTEEESKTLRLLYLDLLKEFGGAVKDQLIKRLGDKRWYVVRNLLFVLRQLNDPSVLSSIYNLFGHPDQRVRHELLHTFLAFKDPRADRILLQEINSGDSDRCLKAIMLAGMTRNSDVFEKLIKLIEKKGLNKTDLEIKKASVHTLAEIGDPSVLPILQRVLKSFSLFSHQKLKFLKLEIIASLGKYPAEEVFPILQKIANSRSGELAVKAGLTIRALKAGRT